MRKNFLAVCLAAAITGVFLSSCPSDMDAPRVTTGSPAPPPRRTGPPGGPQPSPTTPPNVPTAYSETLKLPDIRFPEVQSALEALSPRLSRVLGALARSPYPNLLNSHDLGVRTEYSMDMVWHSLRKEREAPLPRYGQLGVINPGSELTYSFAFEFPDGSIRKVIPTTPIVHTIDLLADSFDVGLGLKGSIIFLPADSSTLFVFLEMENTSLEPVRFRLHQTLSKEVFHYQAGYQRRPRSMRLMDSVLHTRGCKGVRRHADMVEMNFEEWSWAHIRQGAPLGTMAAFFGSDRATDEITSDTPAPPPLSEAQRFNEYEPSAEHYTTRFHKMTLAPGGKDRIVTFLTLCRYANEPYGFPRGAIPFLHGDRTVALARARDRIRVGAATDWDATVRERLAAYEPYPAFDLPIDDWESMALAALQLPRAETYSAEGRRTRPFYNFCRAYGNDLFRWWSYGMHAHESMSTFVTALTEPALAQDHLYGHLECQEEDGAFPYGVGPVSSPGQRVFFSANVTAPFIAWECWNAYLWSGDRQFLRDAYAACRKSHDYWLRTRDRTGEGLCCWLDFGETVRDDGTVPTWRDPEAPTMFQEALDLNCYLLNMERILREMAAELGDPEGVQRFEELWDRRAQTMNALLWDGTEACYYGTSEITPDKFVRVKDISTLMPLWCGLAPPARAEKLIEYYRNPALFQTPWPVPVLNASDNTYLGDGHWHGGNWIEMTWLVIQGLRNYGLYEESARLALRNVQMSFNEFKARSHLREYFDSATGTGLSLNDYIWAALPGYLIVESFYGVRAVREGVEIMPSLPEAWSAIDLEDLRIRGIPVDLSISRDPSAETTTTQVNGKPWTEIRGNRGILIPWERLSESPGGLSVSITQPATIQETLAPPYPLPENVLEPVEAPPRIQPIEEEIAFMENQQKNDRDLRYSHYPAPVVKPPVREK